MNDIYAHVSVKILEKEYQVSCPASEILNARMREISDSGKVVGLDRIAVMAALNMANELLHARARDRELEGTVGNRLRLMSDRVESVLHSTKQLDFAG